MPQKYDVAAYIWPAYTGDEPRTRPFWPEGMGEWQSVKNARAKFPGHSWPRRPLWGYVNEANPDVMEMEINAALRHGVNVFLYDWYWYDGRPFLENCLNDGFLQAANNRQMKFYLMWANHNVNNLWDIRLSGSPDNLIWTGQVNRQEFERIARRLMERYFHLPNYYQIDGKPVFMIYDACNLVRGLGGLSAAAEALHWFDEEAVRAGLKGVHFQGCLWVDDTTGITGVDGSRDLAAAQLFGTLPFSSATHYQFAHFVNMNRSYPEILADVKKEWDKQEAWLSIPYFPHVSVGWDNNPRYLDFMDYVTRDDTPENFEKGLRMAKEYADTHSLPASLITINSWNEWTETSYLLPDDRNGYGYLEAIRRVFGRPSSL